MRARRRCGLRLPVPTIIHQHVRDAQQGINPRVVTRTACGWVVMGETQVVPGYCLLLPDPVPPHLNALAGAARETFLRDMTAVGDALLRLTGAARINYEILGNLEPALHAHLFPRRDDEPEDRRTRPVWFHDWQKARRFDPDVDRPFMEALRRELERAGVGRLGA